MLMTTKSKKDNSDLTGSETGEPQRRKGVTESTGKQALSRQEKLAAAKKANQAMMQAWQLISQRQISDQDAENNV
jgi:hypothetical protein